ncbi:MAG: siroheme synthase CysG [Pseudomonadota bacterium]
MEYLPIFMKLQGREAVVVGGGTIASRKAELIAKSGANMTIVSETFSPAMQAAASRHGFRCITKSFSEGDIDHAHLVVAATDDEAVNAAVQRAAADRRIPVNVVDAPELCSFIMPAIVDRSPMVIAISSGGRSPVLARYLRSWLERTIPTRLASLGDLFGRFRAKVAERLQAFSERRRFWEDVMESQVPSLMYAGREEDAAVALDQMLSQEETACDSPGTVYLIGAGPGDSELLTIKAQRLLQRADVVVYDRLVPVDVLNLCRREAETIYAGKRRGDHPLPQEAISALLVKHAKAGKKVARLKGGDPFTFGRGGEEIQTLVEAGIEFQVVPGISAANGAAAYAGIPLTHRDHAQSVSYWTGHLKDEQLDQLNWRAMAMPGQTLVFYMARPNAEKIAQRLLQHGIPATTPCAIVQAATTPRQQTTRVALRRMPEAVAATDRELPMLLIIGSVVNLAKDLGWYADQIDSEAEVFPRHCAQPTYSADVANA